MKQIHYYIEDDYHEALALLAKGSGGKWSSRTEMLIDISKQMVDNNPGLLERAREMLNGNFDTAVPDVKVMAPKEPVRQEIRLPFNEYQFERLDGTAVYTGSGHGAGEAFENAFGYKINADEYYKIYKQPKVIGEGKDE